MNPASDNKHGAETLIAENTPLATKTNTKHTRYSMPAGKSSRMRLLERQGCFNYETRISVQRAKTVDDFYNAYRLVHDVYVNQCYILPKSNDLRIRLFEATSEMATYIAKVDGKIVGVSSVIPDSTDLGLPSGEVFAEEINQLRRSGRRICEGTNWAIHPEYRRTPVLTELLRCGFSHALVLDFNDIFMAVCPSHASFFELMAFETIGSVRSFSQELEDPVVLVNAPIMEAVESVKDININENIDLALLKSFYLVNNPYHDKVKLWEQKAKSFFHDPHFLRELFVERSDFLENCTAQELYILSQDWGEDVFMNVIGQLDRFRCLSLPRILQSSSSAALCGQPA